MLKVVEYVIIIEFASCMLALLIAPFMRKDN